MMKEHNSVKKIPFLQIVVGMSRAASMKSHLLKHERAFLQLIVNS